MFDDSFVAFVPDIPTQVPPLTPGTNKKMTEALKASFASWEKEQLRLNIVKGRFVILTIFMPRFINLSCIIQRLLGVECIFI